MHQHSTRVTFISLGNKNQIVTAFPSSICQLLEVQKGNMLTNGEIEEISKRSRGVCTHQSQLGEE